MTIWIRKVQNKYTFFIVVFLAGFLSAKLWFSPGSTGEGAVTSQAQKETVWTCSMHPQIKQPNPGQCPLCGMDLIPLQSSPEDTGAVQLTMSEAAEKLAEIQTVPVQRAFAEHALRLVGKVEYDETRLKSITAWFAGRIDRLFVDYTGTPVKQGDHLVELFSPALLTDQEALLQAVRAAQAGGAGSVAVRQNRGEAAERARERLRLLGLTPDQITAIETRGTPSERITFYSPITGIVIQKNAVQGEYVQTGTRIYTIADLTHVWIKMDAYESDLPWIHYGQPVTFTTVSYPGEIFQGQVVFIDPFLDEQTRTVKVRVDVANPQGKLKPGMFVQAVLRSEVNAQGKVITAGLVGKWICPMHPSVVREEKGTCDQCEMPLVRAEESGYGGSADAEKNPPLLIPLSAPLITGTRAVVYVKIPNTEKPVFEGREVVLGPRLEHAYVVLAGLEEGEQVVTKGNFKIDSALQINAKPSMMSETAPDMQAMPEGQQDHPAGMHGDGPPLSLESLPALLAVYRDLTTALVQDQLEAAQQAGRQWIKTATELGLAEVGNVGQAIVTADKLEAARLAYAALSNLLIASIKKHGGVEQPLFLAYCPMAFDNRGGYWLQWDEAIQNPYFGDVMLTCGEIKQEFPAITSPAPDAGRKE